MGTPTSEQWPSLLGFADQVLDHYRRTEGVGLRLGGGTSLTFFVDHRLSFDLDLFVGYPAPRGGHLQRLIQSGLPRRLTDDVRFPGNYVKLAWPEFGEIDLLTAPALTAHSSIPVCAGGVALDLEHPEEVIAKKLVYRTTTHKGVRGRDVYDVLCCLRGGVVRPSNIVAVVGAERFEVVLEALTFGGDRIASEIAGLDGRSYDPSLGELTKAIDDLASTPAVEVFEEWTPSIDARHLTERLGLDVVVGHACDRPCDRVPTPF